VSLLAGFEDEDAKLVQCSLRADIIDRSLLPNPPSDEFGIRYLLGTPVSQRATPLLLYDFGRISRFNIG
jgi:hypothetical protein